MLNADGLKQLLTYDPGSGDFLADGAELAVQQDCLGLLDAPVRRRRLLRLLSVARLDVIGQDAVRRPPHRLLDVQGAHEGGDLDGGLAAERDLGTCTHQWASPRGRGQARPSSLSPRSRVGGAAR